MEESPLVGSSFAEGQRFRAVAVGNIDGDDTLDVWSIDESGQPVNDQNDVEN